MAREVNGSRQRKLGIPFTLRPKVRDLFPQGLANEYALQQKAGEEYTNHSGSTDERSLQQKGAPEPRP
jgi:hypothetical protein